MQTYSYTSLLLSAVKDAVLQCHCHGQVCVFANSTSICSGTYHAGTGRAKGGIMIHAHTQWTTLDCTYYQS